AFARRRLHAEDGRHRLDRVTDADRRAEAHVDVLEVRAPVLGDVLHALAEDDVHHQAGWRDQAAEPVRLGVAPVLGEGVGGEAEVREDGEEALGDRLAALVAEDLPGAEVLQEVAVLGGALGHGAVPLAGGARRRQPRAAVSAGTPGRRAASTLVTRLPFTSATERSYPSTATLSPGRGIRPTCAVTKPPRVLTSAVSASLTPSRSATSSTSMRPS